MADAARQVSRLHRARSCSAGRQSPTRRRAANRILDLETKIARAHATREESEDFAKGATGLDPRRASSRRRRASTGTRCSTPRSSAARRSSRPITPARSRKLAALVGVGAARRVEGLAGLPPAQPAGQRPAQADPRRQLRLQRHRADRARRKQRPRDQLAHERRQQRAAATRSARPMSTNISRPRPRPRSRRWSTSIKAAFARRVEALDWMAPSTKEEALKKVEIDRRRRRLSRHVARLFVARDRADDAYANQKNAEPCRISPPDRQDRQADGPQRMVDAAAAGQRGQPAGAERAQLPGGDPRSGPSSIAKADAGVQLWRDRRR